MHFACSRPGSPDDRDVTCVSFRFILDRVCQEIRTSTNLRTIGLVMFHFVPLERCYQAKNLSEWL